MIDNIDMSLSDKENIFNGTIQQILRWTPQTYLAEAFSFAIQDVLYSIKIEVWLKIHVKLILRARSCSITQDNGMCHFSLCTSFYGW